MSGRLGYGWLLAALALSGCDGSSTARHDTSKPPAIDPGVYQRYTVETGGSKTVQAWGKPGIDRIQKLSEAASEYVARVLGCDAVELSDIAPSRALPPDRPVVYVDCRNGQRFYASEGQGGEGVVIEMPPKVQ